jgi:hypothetical protein
MASHITRQSVLTGLTVYYKGNNKWTDVFADRKVYASESLASAEVQPTPGMLRGIGNGNGSFKNASVVNE